MITAIIYLLMIIGNIISFFKRTDKGKWINLIAILFMIGMAFVIEWHNLP
jgi:hypothetical protein